MLAEAISASKFKFSAFIVLGVVKKHPLIHIKQYSTINTHSCFFYLIVWQEIVRTIITVKSSWEFINITVSICVYHEAHHSYVARGTELTVFGSHPISSSSVRLLLKKSVFQAFLLLSLAPGFVTYR